MLLILLSFQLDICDTLFHFKSWSSDNDCDIQKLVNLSQPLDVVLSNSSFRDKKASIVGIVDVHLKFQQDNICQYYVTTLQNGGILSDGGFYVNATITIPDTCTNVQISILDTVAKGATVKNIDIDGEIKLQYTHTLTKLTLSNFANGVHADAIINNIASTLAYRDNNGLLLNTNTTQVSLCSYITSTIPFSVSSTLSYLSAGNTILYNVKYLKYEANIKIDKAFANNYEFQQDFLLYIYVHIDKYLQMYYEEKFDNNEILLQQNGANYVDSTSQVDIILHINNDRIGAYFYETQLTRVVCEKYFDLDTKSCENTCASPKQNLMNKLCYAQTHMAANNNKCYYGYYLDNENCLNYIPQSDGKVLDTDGLTVKACSLPTRTAKNAQDCVTSCELPYKILDLGCFLKQPEGAIDKIGEYEYTYPTSAADCYVNQLFLPAIVPFLSMCINDILCPKPYVLKNGNECQLKCDTTSTAVYPSSTCELRCPDHLVQQETGTLFGNRCLIHCDPGFVNVSGVCKNIIAGNKCGDEETFDIKSGQCLVCGILNKQYWDRAGLLGNECVDTCIYYNITHITPPIQNNDLNKTQYFICELLSDTVHCPYYITQIIGSAAENVCVKSCFDLNMFLDTTDPQKCIATCSKFGLLGIPNYNDPTTTEYQCVDTCPDALYSVSNIFGEEVLLCEPTCMAPLVHGIDEYSATMERCATQCSDFNMKRYLFVTECVDKCPLSDSKADAINICVYTCTSNFYEDRVQPNSNQTLFCINGPCLGLSGADPVTGEEHCELYCPLDTNSDYLAGCVNVCPDQRPFSEPNKTCTVRCISGLYRQKNSIPHQQLFCTELSDCPFLVLNVSNSNSHRCVNKCANEKLKKFIENNLTCTDECASGYYWYDRTGKQGYCLQRCDVNVNFTAIDDLLSTRMYRCEISCQYFDELNKANMTSHECVRCTDYISSSTNECVGWCEKALNNKCVDKCPTTHFIYDNACISCNNLQYNQLDKRGMCAEQYSTQILTVKTPFSLMEQILVTLSCIVAASIIIATSVLLTRNKSIKSAKNDFYVNENEKIWKMCVVEQKILGSGGDVSDDDMIIRNL